MHWVCLIPTYAYLAGLLALGLLTHIYGWLPSGLFSLVLVGSGLVFLLGNLLTRRVVAAAVKRSPSAGLSWRWRIDGAGIDFTNPLQSNHLDWRVVMDVREERDRFIFFVTPAYNPVLPMRLLTDEQAGELRTLVEEQRRSGALGRGVD